MNSTLERLKFRSSGFTQLFFNGALGKTSVLKKKLHAYPSYNPPFPDTPANLSLEQAQQNFAYFLANKNQRVTMVLDLLGEFGIELAVNSPDRKVLHQMDEWAYQQWPAIYQERLANNVDFNFLQTGFEQRIRSFLFDISVVLGECLLSTCPGANWVIGEKISTEEEQPIVCNRIVILQSTTADSLPFPNYQDMEAQVFYHYRQQVKSNELITADYRIGRVLGEAILNNLTQERAPEDLQRS